MGVSFTADTVCGSDIDVHVLHAGARITWIGFALSSALQAALIFALGDEDAYGMRSSFPYGPGGVREPLVSEEAGLRAPLSNV